MNTSLVLSHKSEKNVSDFEKKSFMTVKQVADAMGVSEKVIQRCIQRINSATPGVAVIKVEERKKTLLDEAQVTLISKELKSNAQVLNQLTYEASSQVAKSTTELEVLGNALNAFNALQKLYNQKEAEYKATIEIMKPKVEFFDKVTGSSDTCDMKEVAKLLNFKGIGRNNLFEILRNEEVLDRQNQPYQKYVDAGYFRIIESKWEDRDGDIHINLKTVVFQKGIEFIRKTVLKSNSYLSNQKVIEDAADKWLNPNPKVYCSCKAE